MTDPNLDWRPAERNDRPALQRFTCTTPAPRVGKRAGPHPKPWEYDLQSRIRELKPPLPPSQQCWLGWDDEGIGAVVVFGESGDGGPAYMRIKGIAVDCRHRWQGGAVARATLNFALTQMEGRALADDLDLLVVDAHIDWRNTPSQKLFASARFQRDEDAPAHDDLESWYSVRVLY